MSVGRNTFYNLASSIAPMAVGLITVPAYLHLIGVSKYGVLTLVWLFLGYFGVFDPGLSRATTYHIARLKTEPKAERQAIFWTAISINSGFGVLGGIILLFVAPPVFIHLLKMPENMRSEVARSIPWLAAAIPVGTIASVLLGTLDGLSEFALANTVGFLGTLAFQLIPLGVAVWLSKDLSVIISATVLARLGMALVFFAFAWARCEAGRPRLATRKAVKELFSYGSWITVSNLIIPFLGTLDKFLIGSYLNVANVTVYTIPDNLTRRCSIIPGALSRTLFPRFASDPARSNLLFRSFQSLLAVMTPITVIFILGLHLFLRLWVGGPLANGATPIGIVLMLGIFLNSLAYLPCMFLQATGRPGLNARFHLIEILPHIVCLVLGIYYLKLMGVALAMLLVSALDAFLLFRAAELRIWKLREFHIALAFITASVMMVVALGTGRWPTYILYALLALCCVIVCVGRSPDLRRRLYSSLLKSSVLGAKT